MRWCTGISSGTFSTNVDPNTLVSGVAIGCSGAADTSLQLYHNDAAGTATKINLASTHGVTFPACTVDDGYALELYSFDGSTITYQVTRLNTGVYVSGTLSTDLPATTAVMLMLYYGSNNADAAVVSLDFAAAEWSQRLV